MTTIALVPASTEDWDRAWEIQRAAFLESVTAEWGGWTPEQVQKCAAAWSVAATRLLVSGGELVGWVRVEHHADHDWLDLLVVAPEHQRRGVGGHVLGVLRDEAAERNVPLWLSVHRTNPARRLYARLGFVQRPRDERRVFMVWPDGGEGRPPRSVDGVSNPGPGDPARAPPPPGGRRT